MTSSAQKCEQPPTRGLASGTSTGTGRSFHSFVDSWKVPVIRVLHSSTFQLNLSHFLHKIHCKHPLIPRDTT